MTYTNKDDEALSLKSNLTSIFSNAEEINIAVGYVSTDTVNEFKPSLLKVANQGGLVRMLVGMAFFEGLNGRKVNYLNQLDDDLKLLGAKNGVYVPFIKRYHGKIYDVVKEGNRRAFVGSNNFSENAFKNNLECSIEVQDRPTILKVNEYIQYLFSADVSTHISNAQVPLTGVPAKPNKQLLPVANPRIITNLAPYPFFDINLALVALKPKSNLNVYFGEGRWSRATGKISPRPWFEIELINPVSVTALGDYPRGNFTLITSDGYEIPMATNGDYYKNMRSRQGLQFFGQWLKGKLQERGALVQYQPVTPETFEIYGKSSMRLYKINQDTYYTDF